MMNSSEIQENELQALFICGLPPSCDQYELRKILENFGNVRIFYISPKQHSGYALFEHHQNAVEAAQNLDQKNWPEGSSNIISVQVISNEEIDAAIRLGIPQLQDVSMLEPETGGSLFNVTKTEPPIYWSFSKPNQ